MSDNKILLGLDGSAQSRYAAEIAWSLAKAGNMHVDAQHVVDSLAAWDFLAFDIAGFIGSGPYFEAHETMRNTLTDIGRNLIEVYRSLAAQQNIKGEAFLDEGATIREICYRAKDYSMVILGQQSTGMSSPAEDSRKLPRRSIAESLTHYCPRPLLVVQDRCKPWKTMRLVVGSDVRPGEQELLRGCVQFFRKLGVEPTARILYSNQTAGKGELPSDKTAPDGLRALTDVTRVVPELDGSKVDVRSTPDINEYWKQDAAEDPDTLLVIPVVEINGVRRTPFGSTPDVIVRYLNHPAVLFWMEGTVPEKQAEPEKSVSGAV
jgi:nucleotide-binding universal stress UspA family protein